MGNQSLSEVLEGFGVAIIEEEAFLQGIQVHNSCPVCKQRVEPDFIFCPWCQTRLKRTCVRCERPLVLRWKMCPFCGVSVYKIRYPHATERVKARNRMCLRWRV